jgi:phytoene/squalene synthetase
MKHSSAALAQAITRSSSKQSYSIVRLLVDKDLADDCMRAYAYFRWADDVIDVHCRSARERMAFISRQMQIIDSVYRNERPDDLQPEEEMVADLIEHDRVENSGLQSFIRNFTEVLCFDARRKGGVTSQAELTWYSHCLGEAVTDAIQYFIGNDHPYPHSNNQYLAATAAHITHMLRDMAEDLSEGFVNIPHEWLVDHELNGDIDQEIMNNADFQEWVRGQVDLARAYFRQGKGYLDQLSVLRCKIAGYWYCARFECVLDAIEDDGYRLRHVYQERRTLSTKLKMGWLAITLTVEHFALPGRRRARGAAGDRELETVVIEH